MPRNPKPAAVLATPGERLVYTDDEGTVRTSEHLINLLDQGELDPGQLSGHSG